MTEVDFYIEKLFNFYNVSTISDLAIKLNTKQSSISSWKTRSSINSIKKKCREIGIYDQIFEETNSYLNNSQVKDKNIEEIYNAIIDDSKYRLREKLKNYTDGSFTDWLNKMIPKKMLTNTLKELSSNKDEYTLNNSKQALLFSLRTLEVNFINEKNKHQISTYIKNELSNIECFVLIQEHEEIMNYKGFWK